MAYLLEVAIIDGGDDSIKVVHQFYGMTERECETYMREHLAGCEYFRAAKKDGRIVEELEEIEDSELPTAGDYEEDDDYEEETG